MRLFSKYAQMLLLPLGLALPLTACGGGEVASASQSDLSAQGATRLGPAADYPVVIGNPFTIDGVTYTPADTLNYDEVGYIALSGNAQSGVSGAHRTLPLPSYVEVTSLESGRTILVRLTERGPMSGNALVSLSQGAADQLAIKAGAPVRVRRVNPPEQQRAMLRSGGTAPERMETPQSLVEVLRRKLPASGTVPVNTAKAATPILAPPPVPAANPVKAMPTAQIVPTPVQAPKPPQIPPMSAITKAPAAKTPDAKTPDAKTPDAKSSTPKAAQMAAAGPGRFIVQAGAFSNKANADRVAGKIGGAISRSGSLYLVRLGPFQSRKEAEASLAKVKAAGYSDARIYNKS